MKQNLVKGWSIRNISYNKKINIIQNLTTTHSKTLMLFQPFTFIPDHLLLTLINSTNSLLHIQLNSINSNIMRDTLSFHSKHEMTH